LAAQATTQMMRRNNWNCADLNIKNCWFKLFVINFNNKLKIHKW
jgi:hypothetical protein